MKNRVVQKKILQILLLFGIIIFAIIGLGFLLISIYSLMFCCTAQVSKESCRAELVYACIQCKHKAWNDKVNVSRKMCDSKFIKEILGISQIADNSGNFELTCNEIQINCKDKLGIQ